MQDFVFQTFFCGI